MCMFVTSVCLISESSVPAVYGVSVKCIHYPLVQCHVECCHLVVCCELLSFIHEIQWLYWQTKCLVSMNVNNHIIREL